MGGLQPCLGEYVLGPGEELISYPPDNMWAFLATTPGLQARAQTMTDAVAFADAVIVGRYVTVERGGCYGSDRTAVAVIDVDTVVKGEPQRGPDGRVRIEFVLVVGSGGYPEKQFEDLQRSIPTDPALLLLQSWATFLESWGVDTPGWAQRDDLDAVYRTIGGDGAMRIVDGRIEPPPYIEGWPTLLKGRGATEVIAEISALTDEAPLP